MKLKDGDKIGIVGCSNAQLLSSKVIIEELFKAIIETGLIPISSNFIFQKYSIFSGSRYSDLTTIINAIYTKTGHVSYLYQIRNLIYDEKELQVKWFINSILFERKDLFNIKYSFIQGNKMEGIVLGGNIRCLLKLAGTSYMPNFENKILFLEAFGGDVGVVTTYLNQLKQMKVFSQINGILLGTYTKMEEMKFK